MWLFDYLSFREKKTCLIIFSFCISLASASGCGYHFRKAGEPIGISIASLAVPLMTSTSSSLGFEGDFTRIIREEFISHAKMPLVSKDEADAVLIGKIHEIRTEPYTYTVSEDIVQGDKIRYEVTNRRWLIIKLDAELIDKTTGKVIWVDKGMREKSSFEVSTDPLANRYNQRKAVLRIAKRFAERLYLKTMQRF